MKRQSFFSISISVLTLIIDLILTITLARTAAFISNCYFYITFFSLGSLLLQLVQLKKFSVPFVSIFSIFLILLHIFNFGNYYLKAFSQENFFIYSDWFLTDISLKCATGMFMLSAIQGLFIGILLFLIKSEKNKNDEYKFEMGYSNESKRRAIYITGIILFIFSLPFRLIVDFSSIAQTVSNGLYSGISASIGISDDVQILFLPSLICLMYGKRNNKKFITLVFLLYIAWCIFVMAASGARRYYITSIVAIVVFYYNLIHQKKRRTNFFALIVTAITFVLFLNLMFLIRQYRHTQLGISYLLTEHFTDLFSLDFIWNSISEFGLTGNVAFFALKFVPSALPFQYGYTYLASIIYILPIGWLVSLNASVGALLYSVSGSPVGGSILGDLYVNWGWVSIIFAILIGYFLASIGNIRSRNNSIKNIIGYSLGAILINYPRASSSEIIRLGVYIVICVYLLSFFILERKKRTAYVQGR